MRNKGNAAQYFMFFFLIGKGETRDTGDTGDTGDTTGHRGHTGHKRHKGT